MSEKKSILPWLFLPFAFLLGGLVVWLWRIITQPVASLPEASSEAPPPDKIPLETVPAVSPTDYETWLDWLVSRRHSPSAQVLLPDSTRYQTWLNPILNRVRFHWLVASIGISLLTFLFGLTLAILFDFFPLFIRTTAIYLAVFGTAIGLAAFYWVGQAFPSAFIELGPYFGVSAETYADFIKGWLRRMYNTRAILTISAIVVLTSFAAMVAVFLFPDPTIDTLQNITPSLVMLDREWYFGGASFAKMLIIDLYFLINFTLVISGAWICIHALLILYHLAKMPILPIPTVVTLKLRVIVNIFVVVCLVWLIAVAVFVLLFLEAIDFLSIIWIGSQAILVMITFLLPQFLSRRIILNLREELIAAARLAYDRYFEQIDAHEIEPEKRLKLLNQLAEEANSMKSWPAEPFDWLLILAGQALPPATAYIRTWVERYL
jgi:hypothetical protein